jgi:hypothetical protein
MGNKIITDFGMFINESEAYVFEGTKSPLMIPTEETLIEIMQRQKKYNKGNNPKSSAYKKWKQRQDSLNVYNSLEQKDKDKILDDLKAEFKKKKITDEKYKKVMDQDSGRESKNEMYSTPYVIVSKENITKVEPGDKTPPDPTKPEEKPKELEGTVDLIPREIEGGVFKDNKWENKPESYTNPAVIEELKKTFDALQELIELDIQSGGMLIEKISILASSSRLRNTGNEKLSWLELGKKRSETLAKSIGERIRSIEGSDEQDIESIRKRVFFDYIGSNGDGTSGPDPLSPFKRGYYTQEGIFKDEQSGKLKEKNTLEILAVKYDNTGKQQGAPVLLKAKDLEGKEMTKELVNNRVDYKEFQYNQITVTFNDSYTPPKKQIEVKDDEDKELKTEPIISQTENVKYSIGLKTTPWKKPPPAEKPPRFNKFVYKFKKSWRRMFNKTNKKNWGSIRCTLNL